MDAIVRRLSDEIDSLQGPVSIPHKQMFYERLNIHITSCTNQIDTLTACLSSHPPDPTDWMEERDYAVRWLHELIKLQWRVYFA